jgi:hypothetical protein
MYGNYEYLGKSFGLSTIEKLLHSLDDKCQKFIEGSKLTGSVFVNSALLVKVVRDYFADIDRLKQFHLIEEINSIKVYSYLLFWFLRYKPIQITQGTVK